LTVRMPTSSTCSTRTTLEISFKTTLGVSRTTRQSHPHPARVQTCGDVCFVLQVPHSHLRTLPTEDYRYCLLCSFSTDCRWPTFAVIGCSRVAIGAISVVTYSANP
jgi:hypothetical protein